VKALSLLLTLLLLTLSCTGGGDQIAGSKGGSETTNGVTAIIVHADGTTPAAGSTVRLRKADFVSDVSALSKTRVVSADIITDSQGRFIINPGEIDTGSYYIEIINTEKNSSQNGTVLLKVTIKINNGLDTVNLGTETLRPFASLLGQIDSGAMGDRQLYVQIKGLERIKEVAPDGTFTFDDLPAGTHCVRIVDAGSALVKEVENVRISSGGTLTVKMMDNSHFSSFIQINTSAAELSSFDVIDNFPLLIRLNSQVFDFSKADAAGNDIRFSKLDGKSLPYEIEEWNQLLGQAAVWVLIDTVWGGRSDQFIVMNWGMPEASNLSSGAVVFDTALGFRGVWHFNEDPSAGIDAVKDRTVNGLHGSASSTMTSSNVVSGVAGNALMFNGVSDSIEAGLLQLTNYTLSCWVKMEQGNDLNWRFIFTEQSYTLWYDTRWSGFRAEHFTYIAAINEWQWRGINQDSEEPQLNMSAKLDVWYHIAATWDGDRVRLFVNGEVVDSTVNFIGHPSFISREPLLFGGRNEEFFKGTMDEVRIERTARSAEWIKLCYETQRIGAAVVRY